MKLAVFLFVALVFGPPGGGGGSGGSGGSSSDYGSGGGSSGSSDDGVGYGGRDYGERGYEGREGSRIEKKNAVPIAVIIIVVTLFFSGSLVWCCVQCHAGNSSQTSQPGYHYVGRKEISNGIEDRRRTLMEFDQKDREWL